MAGAPLKDDLELDASILLGMFLGTRLADGLRHGYADLAGLGAACGASAAQVREWLFWEAGRRRTRDGGSWRRRTRPSEGPAGGQYRPRDPQAQTGLTASEAFRLA